MVRTVYLVKELLFPEIGLFSTRVIGRQEGLRKVIRDVERLLQPFFKLQTNFPYTR